MTVGHMVDYSAKVTSGALTSSTQSALPIISIKNTENSKDEIEPITSSCTSTKTSDSPAVASGDIETTNDAKIKSAYSLGYLKKLQAQSKFDNDAQYLASPSNHVKRIQEIIALLLSVLLIAHNLFNLIICFDVKKSYVIFFAAVIGILAADFMSGFVHWVADSYGSVDIFLIGEHLLRNFREHHIDPTAITRHDFIETNGDNFSLTLPFSIYQAYKLLTSSYQVIQLDYNWHLCLFSFEFFVSMTNQFHKWSHTPFGLPGFITMLQRFHLILPRKHHHIHHLSPHDTHFCITVGWLNYPLQKINFWKNLEISIFKLTGIQPREDDMKWALKSK